MPEHLPGFEILTKHKEVIRQLINYAAIPIPKLMAHYKLGIPQSVVLNYEAPLVLAESPSLSPPGRP